MKVAQMPRYHPLLAGLHWLMALMIMFSLAAGGLVLHNMPPDSPEKLRGLGGHMAIGMTIGALLVLRLVIRQTSKHPPRSSTGSKRLDQIAVWTHWIFYLLIAGMVASGLATALGAQLFPIVYGGVAASLPQDLAALPQRVVHSVIACLLVVLIALHLAAALFHHFGLRDGLLHRMWFEKRRRATPGKKGHAP